MVFIVSMGLIILMKNWGEFSLAYAFLIAIAMEMLNVLIISKMINRTENGLQNQFNKVIEKYKEREKYFAEKEAALIEASEAEKQRLEEERKIILHKDRIIEENKRTIDLHVKKMRKYEEMLEENKNTIDRQELIIRHLKGEKA